MVLEDALIRRPQRDKVFTFLTNPHFYLTANLKPQHNAYENQPKPSIRGSNAVGRHGTTRPQSMGGHITNLALKITTDFGNHLAT